MRAALILLAGVTGGCTVVDDAATEISGLGAGAAVGALTGNPFVAVAAGVAARWGANEAVNHFERRHHRRIHTDIAAVAGGLDPGEAAEWRSGGIGGLVEVSRELGRVVPCREIVYSLRDGEAESFYVAVICRGEEGWSWAVSEPSTDKWGPLE